MWCVGKLTEEYRERMYDLLDLYARPFRLGEPVVCLDEKSKQLHRDSRPPLLIKPGTPARRDYEYVRAGTCNLFVAVEPKGGHRTVTVTDHRTKVDFVAFVQFLLEKVYARARRVHLVMDNLNTHFRKCFEEVLGVKRARTLLRRAVFHYTPKHASWLNMAEIEIGILDRQCLDRRLPNRDVLTAKVNAWQQRRNAEQRGIEWTFTRQDADVKMARHYVS
ncbi:MAG: IS630 family transposase [Pseudomonadales bacterium]|nr:IS630 family transposase [Halioglobus sp.]MCP5121566.1 IS630 family transposase [Pseudomonadales bacterium]MCP5195111.1 IS630 family transposase [Pseudomonadales bacterium]